MSETAPAASPANFASIMSANRAAAPAPAAPAPAPAAPAAQPASVATLPTSQPANTNAQPAAPTAPEPVTAQPAQQAANDQSADPWERAIHGSTVRELVAAIEAGEMPASALEHVKVPVRVNGKDLTVSLREAANGYMRISDHTQKSSEVARERDAIEGVKDKLRAFYEPFNTPDGFEKLVTDMGYAQHARQMLTKGWGTAEKPNVQAFMEDMRRNGAYPIFRAAVDAYANQYDAHMRAFPMPQDQARALQVRQYAEQAWRQREAEQDAMWQARIAAEQEAETVKRERAKADRDQLLAKRQQQPQDLNALRQKVNTLRDGEFQKLGLAGGTLKQREAIQGYFEDNMAALVRMAKRAGQSEPIESIVAQAAQAAFEQFQDQQGQAAAPTAAPAGLPVRPGAAPAAGAPVQPKGGSASDLEALIRQRRGG